VFEPCISPNVDNNCAMQSSLQPTPLRLKARRAATVCRGIVARLHWGAAPLGLLLAGCATHQPDISSSPALLEAPRPVLWQPGSVALAYNTNAATFSFQKAKGKLGSAKVGLAYATEIAVSGPIAAVAAPGVIIVRAADSINDYGQLFWVAAGGLLAGGAIALGSAVAAPVVATKGLVRSLKTLSPAELAERERFLSNAMSQMADQSKFRDLLLQAAADKGPGLIALGPSSSPLEYHPRFASILEANVEELRLERSRSDEGSYFLRIKLRARLTRQADGSIQRDQILEYRSGRGLFLDWTLAGSVEGVAETGYRALARYIVDYILRDA